MNPDAERILSTLDIYSLILGARQAATGFYLPDVECINCGGAFLFALELDSTGAPMAYVRCALCAWEAVEASNVTVIEEDAEFITRPIKPIQETS
jgi:hypothetical protein